jgi:type II secretory pathway pseudopilin PulG
MLKKKTQSGKAWAIARKAGAFTLPEVIVAMSVLIMVVVASTNLLVSIIRNNSQNINSLVAFELAQQGIEGMRNVRDSNWLLGADFKGTIGTQKNSVWGSALPDLNLTQYYTLDLKDPDPDFCKDSTINSATIATCAPWSLKVLNDQPVSTSSATLLYKQGDPLVKYVHEQSDLPSPFHRYIKVETVTVPYNNPIDYKNNEDRPLKYRVTVVVSWTESGRDREVSLTTELTDWKGGPL